MHDYSAPLDQLVRLGDPRDLSKWPAWPNYLELGFNQEHIPELIRMLGDEDLKWADSEDPEVWAPLHAWRTLGQLGAVEAIEPLLDQLYLVDEDPGDDWVGEEAPRVFALIGTASIPALIAYLANPENGVFARSSASNALATIGSEDPDNEARCIEAIRAQLALFEQNTPTLNGLLVSNLLDLSAVGALETIREAYRRDCVDLSIAGDLEDVEIDLGVRQERSTPRPNYFLNQLFDKDEPAGTLPTSAHTPFIRKNPKIGRNDPCPCGSGKKYKKCCMNKT